MNKLNVRFVVLDRPNPINGVTVTGPLLDEGSESFVGFHTIPIRHGMTVGELAKMIRTEERLDVHVEETDEATDRVLGMEGREDLVAGQRRLDGDVGGEVVADLADHDHVRILAHDVPQGLLEAEVDGGVYRALRDPVDHVLDGILCGDDARLRIPDLVHAAVEGRRLPRPRRDGDHHDAARPQERILPEAVEHRRAHGDRVEGHELVVVVEQAHDDLLAVHRDVGSGRAHV